MKKYILILILFTLSQIAITPLISAQDFTDITKLNPKDIINIKLPPIDSLFENAKNGPIYTMWDAKEAIERKNLSKEKKAFLGFFSIRGSYQYGMFGNEATYTDVTIAPYLTIHIALLIVSRSGFPKTNCQSTHYQSRKTKVSFEGVSLARKDFFFPHGKTLFALEPMCQTQGPQAKSGP